MSDKNISSFFENEYTQYGVYDVARKIGNYIDGLKISSRKVIHTVIKHNINAPKKVSQLQSTVAEKTQYLHGEASLAGVIVGLAQNYTGANNVPLLKREGNFGSRLIPTPAATRYIYTAKEPIIDYMFREEDIEILNKQFFEGDEIEPQFFVPTLPLIVINGSEAVSTGFAQKILPRNPRDVISYIKERLNGKKSKTQLLPYYRNFKGTVTKTGQHSYCISGLLTVTGANTVLIEEIPVGYTLSKYLKHLEKLEENKTIQDFTDYSNEDIFKFEIKMSRETLKSMNHSQLLQLFKLNDNESENLTCNDENWQITQFDSIEQLIDRYIDIKLSYTQKRKDHMINKYQNDLIMMLSKYLFIKGVVEETIIIHKKPYAEIEKQLMNISNIVKYEDSYEYLLRMPINSLTEEKFVALKKKIDEMNAELKKLKNTSPKELWLNDINQIEQLV